MLITGDDRGNVTNFRDQTGAVWWKFKSGARIGTIVETDDGIVVGSFDNFVYLISKYSGDVKWKRRLEGRVTHRPIVAGKELIFTVSGEEDLVILDAENGKVLEQVGFGEGRYPVADPILLDRGIYVFPNVGGMTAFSASGCK
jgi:outer membrane protein assembly factor BamB